MSAAIPTFQRETFELSRAMEFFSERELTAQIGFSKFDWPIALLKELLDNSLDACEHADIAPVIHVDLHDDALAVTDNGPGLPLTVIERSLDYDVRVSDKTGYISPSRGQQGNALKTLWAAPFVATGTGRIEVETGGDCWEVTVTLDRIAQRPIIELTRARDSDVKTGTKITLHWVGIASTLALALKQSFYTMLYGFTDLNPHLTLSFRTGAMQRSFAATDPTWRRWSPREPTAPHWYTPEQLRNLIAQKLGNEQNGGDAKTINQFIREFRGLSGTGKAKAVAQAVNLGGSLLSDLIDSRRDLDMPRIKWLLTAMQQAARPVNPPLLGVLGPAHCTRALEGYGGQGVQYRVAKDTCAGLPYVLETAFAILPDGNPRHLIIGVNFTYAIHQPFTALHSALSEDRVESRDPVIVLVHFTCPHVSFTDRGKTRIELPPPVAEKLVTMIKAVTKQFTEAKRHADRRDRMRAADMEALRKAHEEKPMNAKQAAWQVMDQAYLKASSNNTLPANARQIMYAARRRIIGLTGKAKPWSDDAYFTQTLLPDFMENNPELTANWDVVFDDRGHFEEPHTGKKIGIGTLAVRGYVKEWETQITASVAAPQFAVRINTNGPANRYRFALFLEKEGFDALVKKAKIAERFDVAIFSTKGMSVTAARQLVEALSDNDVTVLVVRDFDLYGFRIAHTICNETRRYKFKKPPNVIDLGLRLADAEIMGLDSEETEYGADPTPDLRRYGATDEEIEFLAQHPKTPEGNGRGGALN